MTNLVKLEKKIAYFIDLGEINFSEIHDLQKKLMDEKKEHYPDFIFSATHPSEITFGARDEANLFDPDFLEEIQEKYGNKNEETIISHLNSLGIKFSRNVLGGGSTALGTGQYAYYFVIDSGKITGSTEMNERAAIRPYFNNIMIETAQHFIPNDLDDTNIGKYKLEVDNKADVFVKGEDKMLKVASKGIRIGRRNNSVLCIGGFTFFVGKSSTNIFKYVLPCGLEKENTVTVSWEELAKREINPNELHDITIQNIQRHFGYDTIERIPYDKFKSLYDIK